MGVDDLEEGFADTPPSGLSLDADQETAVQDQDYPTVSTPRRVNRAPDPTPCSPIATQPQNFSVLPGVANIPPWIKKAKDPVFKTKPIETRKFVDDGINMNKINLKNARMLVENGRYFKSITDERTQALVGHIASNAEAKGMAINQAKTGLMCVSAATSFDTQVRIDVQGVTVNGMDSMNILGLRLDRDCSFKSHIRSLAAKLRSKTWTLSKLRKRGLDQERLVHVYKTLIRPSVEYLAPVWSSMITAEQAEQLERQQVQALKNIFGPA